MSSIQPILSNFQNAERGLIPKGDILVWLTSLPKPPTPELESSIFLQVREIVEDPNFVPADHRQALSRAIVTLLDRGRPEMFRLLVQKYKIGNPQGWEIPQGSEKPFLSHCFHGGWSKPDFESLAILLEENANPNILGPKEPPPLALVFYHLVHKDGDSHEARAEAIHAAHKLLDAKADPILKEHGLSGLDYAVRSGDFDLVVKARKVALDLHPGMRLPRLPRQLRVAAAA